MERIANFGNAAAKIFRCSNRVAPINKKELTASQNDQLVEVIL